MLAAFIKPTVHCIIVVLCFHFLNQMQELNTCTSRGTPKLVIELLTLIIDSTCNSCN